AARAGPDAAAHGLHQLLAERETDAGAGDVDVRGRAVEVDLPQAAVSGGRQGLALVQHHDNDAIAGLVDVDLDRPARRGDAFGVRDEVGDGNLQPGRVADGEHRLVARHHDAP